MSKIVLITGASSGFGKASAEKFAAAGYNCIINGRREERLRELAAQLEEKYRITTHILPFDVRDQEKVFSSIGNLPTDWQYINVLINNAGLALGRDYFEEADIEDWNTMVDTNVKGFMYVAKAVSKLMVKHSVRGHIINLGSIAGKQVYEKGNVYCATKYAVEALNQAMRIDLLRHQIKVTGIHPGAADTEFSTVRFKGDATTANSVYNGLEPLTAEDVAGIILYTASLPAHVCINDLVVTCTRQADTIYYNRNA